MLIPVGRHLLHRICLHVTQRMGPQALMQYEYMEWLTTVSLNPVKWFV
jgi:hypothetical protein